jgi:Na+/proline symporter
MTFNPNTWRKTMDPVLLEDLIFGVFLAVLALVSIVVAVKSARNRDREGINMGLGFGIMCGFFALVLCTGWVNVLPLPR